MLYVDAHRDCCHRLSDLAAEVLATGRTARPVAFCRVQLLHEQSAAIVDGKRTAALTQTQIDVIAVLVEAKQNGRAGVSKSALEDESGHSGAVQALRKLCGDPSWRQVVKWPRGKGNGGYSIKD